MLIGIMSDTHNNIERTNKALGIFRMRGVGMVLHTGDIMSYAMLALFSGFKARFVLGNEDRDAGALNRESERLGFGPIERQLVFDLAGKKFIMFHGTDVPLFRESVASGKYDYIIKGHTHFFENYISNKSRIINPGALHRAYEFTVAILDTETDNVEMISIE
ncbi:MAG: YfcE family phosphodiesterase [Spirochaetia bacterium]|nr:YfcE family phosphodiesterase [Spirochaetia bacterium]